MPGLLGIASGEGKVSLISGGTPTDWVSDRPVPGGRTGGRVWVVGESSVEEK